MLQLTHLFSGYLQLAESKLKALSVAVRLKKPDKQFEHIKNYGVELQASSFLLSIIVASFEVKIVMVVCFLFHRTTCAIS